MLSLSKTLKKPIKIDMSEWTILNIGEGDLEDSLLFPESPKHQKKEGITTDEKGITTFNV